VPHLLRSRQITWVFALLLGVLALSFSYVSGRRYVRAVAWVEHTLAVERTLEAFLVAIVEEESSTRGYVVTGDPAFLERLEADRAKYERNLFVLRELTRDNPEQVRRVDGLERALRQKAAIMKRTAELREEGAIAEAADRVASLRGKVLMDEIRASVEAMSRQERLLLAGRNAKASTMQRDTVIAIVAGVLVLMILLAKSFSTIKRDAKNLEMIALDLADSEERYRVLVENSSELVRLHGPDGHPFFVSPSVEHLLGYTAAESIAKDPFALVHPDDVETSRAMLQKLQSRELDAANVVYRLLRKDGTYRWFEFHFTRVAGPGGTLRHYQSSGRDITERRELEERLALQTEELRSLSLRDGLTGLYNRRAFLELSAQVLRSARREQQRVTLIFVDLDGLKGINDRLGHEAGDRAIAEAGELLRATCRSSDIVCRLGGDEFVVLASKLDAASVEILKGRLDRAVDGLNRMPGREYELSFSMGLATFEPTLPVPIETLLAQADARMYESKAQRRRRRQETAERPTALRISSERSS
jgi:diguanylate cyclase (GGDEF)-like protein/PAS domain S-box-containing protein